MHHLITYRLQSLQDLAAMEFPDREWLVAGLLPRGSLTLFAGREKSGKSLFVTDLAACITGAEPFLDREVLPGPVILVPAEENLRDIQLRLETRLAGNTEAPLFVLPVNSSEESLLDLAVPECMTALRTLIVETEPAALILDPFRELHRLAENDADAMGPLLRPLRQLAHETNTAIVLTHHMSKSGNFRGSTAIRAAVDQELAFRRPDESDNSATELAGTLSIEGRFGPRQQLGIRLGDGLRWHLSIQALESASGARSQLLEYLARVTEPVTAHEVAAATGLAVKTVQNVIAEERRKGLTTITVSGSGRRSDPFSYSLS